MVTTVFYRLFHGFGSISQLFFKISGLGDKGAVFVQYFAAPGYG
jgi:hypothetical protein